MRCLAMVMNVSTPLADWLTLPPIVKLAQLQLLGLRLVEAQATYLGNYTARALVQTY